MRLEIQVIIHATEDQDRILSNLKHILPYDRREIKRFDLTGHYKNPITMYRITIRDKERIIEFLKKVFGGLSEVDKTYLLEYLDDYMEKNKLYLRIDKSSLCMGKMSLGESDPIRIMVSGIKRAQIQQLIEGG